MFLGVMHWYEWILGEGVRGGQQRRKTIFLVNRACICSVICRVTGDFRTERGNRSGLDVCCGKLLIEADFLLMVQHYCYYK